MATREGRLKEWGRTVGVTAAASLVVAAAVGAFVYRLSSRDQRDGRATKTVEQATRESARGPSRTAGRPADRVRGTVKPKPIRPDASSTARAARPTREIERLVRQTDAMPRPLEGTEQGAGPESGVATGAGGSDASSKDGSKEAAPPGDPGLRAPAAVAKAPEPGATLSPAERKKAEASWRRRLADLHIRYHAGRSDDAKRRAREKAEAELNQIQDPLAAPAIWQAFAGKTEHHYLLAQTLDRLVSSASTRMLAALAIYSDDEKARRWAANALLRCDPAHFVEHLIGLFNAPLRHRVVSIEVPGEGHGQVLHVEGALVDYQFLYPPPETPRLQGQSTGIYTAENPYTYLSREERQIADEFNRMQSKMAHDARAMQLEAAINQVKRLNERIRDMNGRVVAVLRAATGASIDADREEWRRWLARREDRPYVPPAERPKPTVAQIVPPLYSPSFIRMPAPT